MISLLVGKDTHAIRAKIATFKKQLDEVWLNFNFHRFPSSNISDAVHCALTPAFGTSKAKLVVVEDCDFKQFSPEMLPTLQLLNQVPPSTHLVLWGTSIDKRLKVVKFLLGYAKLFEFELIPPWRTDLIAADIGTLATQLKLSLDRKKNNSVPSKSYWQRFGSCGIRTAKAANIQRRQSNQLGTSAKLSAFDYAQ